ncbi:MAG: glutamate-1-semialdehyde 2,1-aminomutase [Hydrotalea sp.]|nr:glutamate-1-semialdehyde 2,1-aminomutase [Hydrotalea sp.]
MKKYEKSIEISKRLHELIPGGSHTYSKGDDQFPEISPKIMSHADGAYCWDIDGNRFIDWAMGNRVFILGHNNTVVNNAVIDSISKSTNFTRPGILEYELAEYLVNLLPVAEMVKFGKNGSDVTTAAIKLSRAHTKRDYVAICKDHPFFSIHDWFIGTTEMDAGIVNEEKKFSLGFRYNDIDSVKKLFDEYPEKIACLILEPVKNHPPCSTSETDLCKRDCINGICAKGKDNFLVQLKELCQRNGTVLIFDEMISGVRFDIRGAHHLYQVYPDLATYGKCISNGYSFSLLAGKKEIMQLGGIQHNKERVFLLSQTHGSETVGLAATLATLKECQRVDINNHVWTIGKKLKEGLIEIAKQSGLEKYFRVIGFDCNPQIVSTTAEGVYWSELHTLFHQHMIENNILIPWISITYSHTEKEVEETLNVFKHVLNEIKQNINENKVTNSFVGNAVKPVFRKYN